MHLSRNRLSSFMLHFGNCFCGGPLRVCARENRALGEALRPLRQKPSLSLQPSVISADLSELSRGGGGIYPPDPNSSQLITIAKTGKRSPKFRGSETRTETNTRFYGWDRFSVSRLTTFSFSPCFFTSVGETKGIIRDSHRGGQSNALEPDKVSGDGR